MQRARHFDSVIEEEWGLVEPQVFDLDDISPGERYWDVRNSGTVLAGKLEVFLEETQFRSLLARAVHAGTLTGDLSPSCVSALWYGNVAGIYGLALTISEFVQVMEQEGRMDFAEPLQQVLEEVCQLYGAFLTN